MQSPTAATSCPAVSTTLTCRNMIPRKAATPGTDRLSSIDWLTGSDSTSVATREMPATAQREAGSGSSMDAAACGID